MNLENKDLRNIEANNPPQKLTTSSGASTDTAGPAYSEHEIPVAAGKVKSFFRPVFVITGAALCMGLASCVVPYDSPSGGSATVTTYRSGYRVDSLPSGYRSEVISGNTYYYNDGHYYRQGSGGYVVVDAPRSSRYYDDYGRRQGTHQPGLEYQQSSNRHDQGYERGQVITRLPSGYRELNHRGNTYYQVEDRYYRRQGDSYVITTRPY